MREIYITYCEDGLRDRLSGLKKRFKKHGLKLEENKEGYINSNLRSGAPGTIELFNSAEYAITFFIRFLHLAVELGGIITLGYQLNDFLKKILKQNKAALIVATIPRENNFSLSIGFCVNTRIKGVLVPDALNQMKNVIEIINSNIHAYENYEMIIIDYSVSECRWQIESFKECYLGIGMVTGLTSNRMMKLYGTCEEKYEVKGKVPKTNWDFMNMKFSEGAEKNALTHKSFYYQRIHNIDEIKIGLRNSPIMLCIDLYESFIKAPNGYVQLPLIGDKKYGGHSITILWNDSKNNRMKFVNSWGTEWGDKGYGYLPYEYIARFFIEGWVMAFFPKISWTKFYKINLWKNFFAAKPKNIDLGTFKDKRGLEIRYEHLAVRSLIFTRGYLNVINIFDPKVQNKYAGWCHYSIKNNIIEIEEIFISPHHRGFGLGKNLFKLLEEAAPKWDIKKIHGWVSVEDANNEKDEKYVNEFLEKCGYLYSKDTSRFRGSYLYLEKIL